MILVDEALDRLSHAPRLVVFLDYDGTLVSFAPSPLLAAPDAELRALIERLAARPGMNVHLVSGRVRETMDAWFGDWPVRLHAEHGYWSKNGTWAPLFDDAFAWKGLVRRQLSALMRSWPGTLLKEKTASIAFHYRGVALPALALPHLRDELSTVAERHGLELLDGDHVLELRAKGVTKGVVVSREVARATTDARFFAMGDDATDEDMFRALPADSTTVHVGSGTSVARYRIKDVAAARRVIARLAM